MTFIPVFLSCTLIFAALNPFHPFQAPSTSSEEASLLLLNQAKNCILNNTAITQKDPITDLLHSLENKKFITESGFDDLRIKYVHAQGAIEQALACALAFGKIEQLVGVIHTPTPATPLCTKADPLDKELLDASIRDNQDKLLTVVSRAVIIRAYLDKGGKLFTAYPKGGFEKRTQQQQDIYQHELATYPDHLFDTVLSCSEMDPSKVGATYFFKTATDEIYAFSIKANQAISPLETSEWGLWFGKIDEPVILQRVLEILDYLKANGGPDLQNLLK